MNISVDVSRLDRTSWVRIKSLNLQTPDNGLVSNATERSRNDSLAVPSVPLTDKQLRDYQSLMAEADTLVAKNRLQEAKRVKQVAANILRTGAPALG